MKQIQFQLLAVIMLVAIDCFCSGISQQSQLAALLIEAASQIKDVKTKSTTIEQSLEFDEHKPWRIIFHTASEGKKDKRTALEYHLNLADIDDNTVRYATKKDAIHLNLRTERQQDFIKVLKDGSLQDYGNSLRIIAEDVGNAQKLQDLLKEAVVLAKKSADALIPENTFGRQMAWMEENTLPIDLGDKTLVQQWERIQGSPTRCMLTITKDGKKGSATSTYSFNLINFGKHTVRLNVKGKEVYVEAKTRRNEKYIETTENGSKGNYASSLKIYADDVDKARLTLLVLEALIEQAGKPKATAPPKDAPLEEVLQQLSALVKPMEKGDKSIQQELTPSCQTSLTRIESDDKEKKDEQWSFHLGDMLKGSVKTEIKGKDISIQFKTEGGEKLVGKTKDEQPENYLADVKILMTDVESMRQTILLLPMAIEGCADKLETSLKELELASNDPIPFLSERITSISDGDKQLDQTLAEIESPCKWRFTKAGTNGKKSIDEIWEFNNADLDPASLKFSISKKEIYVQAGTKHKEKIIKYYKDGEPGDYANSFSVQMRNIEEGRAVIAVWQKAIEGCKD